MIKFPITRKGYEKLEREIKTLKSKGHEISKQISDARDHGDLSENAEYHAAKEAQGFTQGKISDLEYKYSVAEIIDVTKLNSNVIRFGATVKLFEDDSEKEVNYVITGEYEADLAKGRVSIMSPLAKALIGKKVGDLVEVLTPKGIKSYEVLSVKYVEIDV